jgi:hypothetical protein
MEDYTNVNNLPPDYQYFKYQDTVNKKINNVASHDIIEQYIDKYVNDYRFQIAPHPIKELRDRSRDNTNIARTQA